MKILFPFTGDSVGGSHQSILELYRALENSALTPIFVLHKIGPLSNFLDDLGIPYEHIPIKHLAGESPNLLRIIFSVVLNFFKISSFIRRNKIDIIHGNDLRINLTWSLPTRLSNASYVWHQRSVMSSSILWNVSVYLADYFVTISKYVHQSLPSNIPKSKKKLILNPFNIERHYEHGKSREWIDMLYSIPKNAILLGYIGRLVDWKNIDFLIKCFARFNKYSDVNAHLLIVGTGESKYVNQLKLLTRQLDLADVVTFSGFNSKPNQVISAFDVMIAPSDKEPFGRTIVESMIQKTPVLAANGGGHSEIINHGVTGCLYNHKNIENFVTQLNELINNYKMAKNITQEAYIDSCLKYPTIKHVENMINVYNQVRYSINV